MTSIRLYWIDCVVDIISIIQIVRPLLFVDANMSECMQRSNLVL